MTSIQATINNQNFGLAAKRIDVWHEGGGIGRWELELDNASAGSQILATNYPVTNLGINGSLLMKGYLDDVLPSVKDASAVFSKYVKVNGRNYGRDLANLFIIKKYGSVKFDDLVADALALAGSEITFASSGAAPVVDADFNKTFLQTGFAEAATRLGYDFIVNNSKAFQLWSLASAPSSGVLLKSVPEALDNNILLINPETKAGVDIRNYVRVDAGALNDHWTEGNAADFTVGSGCTVDDDTSIYAVGTSSIRATITSIAPTGPLRTYVYLQFPKYSYTYLDLSTIPETKASIWATADSGYLEVAVYAKDDSGNEIIQLIPSHSDSGLLTKSDFTFGPDTIGDWTYLAGSNFTWKITRIGISVRITGDVTSKHVWFDGLQIDGVDVFAVAQDATSISTYGKRMIPINRTDIKSQLQLQEVNDTELANRKKPAYKLTLTCTFQPTLLYAGYLVDVYAPTAYIGYEAGGVAYPVAYRILSVHHVAEPGVDLCKGNDAITELELIRHDSGVGADPTRFKLASSPQAAINTRYDNRLRVLEGSLTGSGSVLAGSGISLSGLVRQDENGYIKEVAGIKFGDGWGEFCRQTVTGNPAYPGNTKVLELSGLGLIIDGCLNVSGISMNSAMTGYSGLVLDNSDGKNGFIQWGATLSTTVRLAQVVLGGHSEQVLAVQAWVGSGGKFNSGTWDLGALDVSLLFVDHIISASGSTVYFFDDIRLYGPSAGHKLYDATNSAGALNQVLQINGSGLPVWTTLASYLTTVTPADTSGSGAVASGWSITWSQIASGIPNYAPVDGNGYISISGIHYGSGYPDLYRNTVSSVKVVECSGSMIIDGNLNVGYSSGGISVNGTIGLTGDLNGNCFIQFGTGTVEGAIRLAKVNTGVLAIQNYHNSAWVGADLNTSQIKVDHISGLTGDVYLFNDTHLWGPSAGHKLYDATNNTGSNGQFLVINSSGYPAWTSYTPAAWNGGTVGNDSVFQGLITAQGSKAISSMGYIGLVVEDIGHSYPAIMFKGNGAVLAGIRCEGGASLSFYTYTSSTWSQAMILNGNAYGGTPVAQWTGLSPGKSCGIYSDSGGAGIGWFNAGAYQDLIYFSQAANQIDFYTSQTLRAYINSSGLGVSGSLTLDTDTNLYRGAANLLKTDDAFLAVGSITTYGDLNMSGKLNVPIDNYIAWNGDVYLRRANTNVLAIDNNSGGLGALNVSIINVDHFKSASAGANIWVYNNFYPVSTNTYTLGTNTYYFGSIWANYLKYHTSSSSFDALDDLALVKSYKTKTVPLKQPTTGQIIDTEVIDVETSLPFLLDEDGFRDPARDVGFLLGCAKFSALQLDTQEKRLTELQVEVDKLKTELANVLKTYGLNDVSQAS